MRPRLSAVVQARLGSSRLPGKALVEIAGRPMLAHLVQRVQAIEGVDNLVLATTVSAQDDVLAEFARRHGLPCVRGSEDDVLDRFHQVLLTHPAEAVVRVTPDCPLLDPAVAGQVVRGYLEAVGGVDYVSNVHPPTYPDGLDTEVISAPALDTAWREARLPSERGHVTPYIWKQPGRFRLLNVTHHDDLSNERWTVDTAGDLAFVRAVYEHLSPDGRRLFGMDEVMTLLRAHPELRALNAGQRRNEGYARSLASDHAVDAPCPRP